MKVRQCGCASLKDSTPYYAVCEMFGQCSGHSDDTKKRPGLCNFILHEKTSVTSKYVIKSVNIKKSNKSRLMSALHNSAQETGASECQE